jgi:hypothetical protein
VVPALVAADGSPVVYNGTAIVDFPAVNCSVVEAHQRVNCTTTQGAGYGIVWLLSIGNQTSRSPVATYGVPSLGSLRVQALRVNGALVPSCDPVGDMSRLSTEGGDVFLVTGACGRGRFAVRLAGVCGGVRLSVVRAHGAAVRVCASLECVRACVCLW